MPTCPEVEGSLSSRDVARGSRIEVENRLPSLGPDVTGGGGLEEVSRFRLSAVKKE